MDILEFFAVGVVSFFMFISAVFVTAILKYQPK